jgi:nicotinate-nucleotide adenylyltransferase
VTQQLVGIFGGSFDPIHHGHLRTLVELEEALGFDQLRLMPAHQSPHKGQPGASNQQRLKMLELAVAGHDHWLIDQRELQRGGASYTVDSLRELRDELPASANLCLIMGTDAFAAFDRWQQWQQILELAHLVVVSRPDEQLPATGNIADLLGRAVVESAEQLREQKAGLVLLQTLTPMAVSATDIRQRVTRHQSIRYLLPDAVWQMIMEQQLYR